MNVKLGPTPKSPQIDININLLQNVSVRIVVVGPLFYLFIMMQQNPNWRHREISKRSLPVWCHSRSKIWNKFEFFSYGFTCYFRKYTYHLHKTLKSYQNHCKTKMSNPDKRSIFSKILVTIVQKRQKRCKSKFCCIKNKLIHKLE